MAYLLADRVIQRGWKWDFVIKVFVEAHNQIVKNENENKNRKGKRDDNDVPVIIHLKYHPRGIQRRDLRQIYNQTLGVKIKNKVIIAVSRPKNLREQLCQSHLPLLRNCNPSDFLPSYQNPENPQQIE